MLSQHIETKLTQVRSAQSGVLACMLLDAQTGMPIAISSGVKNLKTESISAYCREVFESTQSARSNRVTRLSDTEVIIHLKDFQIFVSRLSRGGQLLVFLLKNDSDLSALQAVASVVGLEIEALLL